MNLDQLEVGQVIKNYGELCRVLGIEETSGGNAKKKQLRWIGEHIEYEKQGHKFIVNEILKSEVEPMVDKRTVQIPYIELIEKLVLDLMLQDEKDNKIFLSKSQMFKQLRMVNSNYNMNHIRIPELAKVANVKKEIAEDWYSSTNSMLENSIVRALNSLSNQALVVWNRVNTVDVDTVVDTVLVPSKKKQYDEDGNEIATYDKIERTEHEHREATEEEDLIINKAERRTLQFMNCKNKSEVIRKGKWDDFTDRVGAIISEKANINYYYRSYKILFHSDLVQERADELNDMLLDTMERQGVQIELNESVQDRVLTNAQSRHDRSKSYFGVSKNYRALDNYVPSNQKLNNMFLDVKKKQNCTKESDKSSY